MEPLVSVIVPVYEVEAYLKKCIDSIICQTYTNMEIILVDDGSPDKCGQICDDYAGEDLRIRVIHQDNRGLSDARNTGIINSKGELLSFIDSDDWIEPYMIEKQVQALVAAAADACRCRYWVVRKKKMNLRPELFDMDCFNGGRMAEKIFAGEISHVVFSTLWKRSLFVPDCMFPSGRNFEDTALTWKLYQRCSKVTVIQDVGYYHLVREGSIVHNPALKNYFDRFWALRVMYEGSLECKKELQTNCLISCFNMAAVIWRNIYGFSRKEREKHLNDLEEMVCFVRNHSGCRKACSWKVRFIISFILHPNSMTMAICYWLNRIYEFYIVKLRGKCNRKIKLL